MASSSHHSTKSIEGERNLRVPISSTFFISVESLPESAHFSGNQRHEHVRRNYPRSGNWSLSIRPSRFSTISRSRQEAGSSAESLAPTAGVDEEGQFTVRQQKSLVKYELPGILSTHHKEARKLWIKMLVVFFVLLVMTIMGTMSIYWGGDHSLQFNLRVLTIAVVDFDHGEIGDHLKEMVVKERSKDYKKSLGLVNVDGGEMDARVEEVYRKLHRQDFWFAVIINSNASEVMNAAFSGEIETYDPKGAIQVVYEEARNALVIGEVVYPKVIAFLDQFVLDFTKQKQKALMEANSNGENNATDVMALERQLENPVAVGFTVRNMVPAIPSTAEAATEIGTIYLIIVSFLSVLMFDKLSDTIMGNIPTRSYYIYRIIILPTVYFFLSLFYLCLSCVWHISFSKFYGGSGYVLYWMLSWISMMAFGLCIENINNILGMPFTPVFFVFWVISNVTTGFYPTEMLSNFYKWGIVWPLRHDMMGARAIIYGTKNTLRENFGVLLGWVIISLLLLPGTVWLQLRKKRAVLEKKKGEVLERVWGEPAREKGGVLRMPTLK
ncbi:hypothetical protein ACMFMG_001920 [Clarireedia jacksonii]